MDVALIPEISALLQAENYRGIFDNVPVGIFQSTPDGRLLSANPALAQMLGYDSPENLMSAVTDIGRQLYVDPERRARFIAAARKRDVKMRGEIELRRKDQQIITTRISGTAIRNEDDSIRYLVGIVEDITEQKRAQEELRRSERRNRRLIESSPEAILVLCEGRVVLANNAAGRLFRAANPISLLGRSAMSLVEESCREIAAAQLHITSEERCRLPFAEEEILSLDGTVVPVEVSAIPFSYEGSAAVQWVVHDISEHKRAEEAIRRQNVYLTALHETSLGLVSRLEPDELLKAILIRAAALVQAPSGFLYLYDPSRGDLEMKVCMGFHEKRLGARIKPGEGVVGRVWQSGHRLFIEGYAEWEGRDSDPLLDVIKTAVGIPLKMGAQVLGVIGLSYMEKPQTRFGEDELLLLTRFAELASIALDNARLHADSQRKLEERRRMEVELLRAKEAAEAANRSKSDFLASMSHELRTPLNAIIGFTELTVDQKLGSLNDIQVEYLGYVLQSSRHLLSLINDTLDLAKVEAGKLVIEPSEVKLEEVVLGSLMMVREKALKQRVVIVTDIAGIAGMTILADERKLRQILYNLLANAVKFTPDGGEIRVGVRVVECLVRSGLRRGDPETACYVLDNGSPDGSEPGESPQEASAGDSAARAFLMQRSGRGVEVSVSDTGIGIKEEDLERIFKPFEQTDSPMNRRFEGTGLGLSLTRRLVELHGGKVWAQSQGLGKGSTFRFIIPVC